MPQALLARVLAGLVGLAVSACFDGPSTPGSEKTCQANCDRQAQAGCANTPATFIETCKSGCLVYRAGYANCVSQMNAMSACVERKVTFTCEPNGDLSADPVAICLDEEYDCIDCTGDVAACRN